MSGIWSGRVFWAACLVVVGACMPAWGGETSFTGVGVLGSPYNVTSEAWSVSQNGDYAACEALDDPAATYTNTDNVRLFVYAVDTGTKTPIVPSGYIKSGSGYGINQQNDGTSYCAVDVDPNDYVHVTGTAKALTGYDRAFYYDGGTGTSTIIPNTADNTTWSMGQAILCYQSLGSGHVAIAGLTTLTGIPQQAFRWDPTVGGNPTALGNTPDNDHTNRVTIGAWNVAYRGSNCGIQVHGTNNVSAAWRGSGCTGNNVPGGFTSYLCNTTIHNDLLDWTQLLPCSSNNNTTSTAWGGSKDGQWVVGSSTFDSVDALGNVGGILQSVDGNRMAYLFDVDDSVAAHPLHACVNSPAGSSRMLGFLPGGTDPNHATDGSEAMGVSTVNYTGTSWPLVVGRAYINNGNWTAFIWDATHGMRDLKGALTTDYGLNLTGWELTDARAISSGYDKYSSPNGFVICGNGVHNGAYEGWVAKIDRGTAQGACCHHADRTCTLTMPSECQGTGMTFTPSPATCSGVNAVACCNTPSADSDGDGDVDQDDFGAFQICYSGTNGGVPAGCEYFDRNSDGAINDTDFQAFSNCWTGSNVPWTQAAAPLCQP